MRSLPAILTLLTACSLACAAPRPGSGGRLLEPELLALERAAAESITAGQPARALQLLDDAVAGGAADTATWFLRGVAQVELGHPAAATIELQRAIAQDPQDAPSQCVLARAYRDLGELPAAAAALRRALEIDPGLDRMRTLLGHVYLDMGAVGEAYEVLIDAVTRDPDDADAHRGLGLLFSEVGDAEQAELAWRHALDLEPGDVLLLLGLGNALRDQERLAEALDNYREAARLAPDNALAAANEASTLFELGRFREARQVYERVLSLPPMGTGQRRWVMLNFGSLLELMGDDDAAMDVYELAVAEDPEFTEAHQALGLANMRADRPERALEHLRRALDLDGLNAEGAMSLALLSEAQGDAEAARQCASMLSFASAADPEVAFRYAQLLVHSRLPEIRDDQRAIDILEELLEERPEDLGAVWDLLGEAFYAQGAVERAVSAAERALQNSHPDNPAWERYAQRRTFYLSRLDPR